ncbi:hypothetical protein [Candidatus Avelusimicrobium fimicolum]|uniref:hypothetical protein n=1 Tax=Candidatus Avelusimicrobium fimicolum TaxID=3416216 RepID=UPI003D11D7EE
MKKMFILCVLISTLCACNTMQGLRVHNEAHVGKQQINGGLYYNDRQAIGHDAQVKHKVIDNTHAQIEIPVHYQETMAALPKQLPGSLKEALKEYDLQSVGKCTYPGSLTKQALTLDLNYKQIEGGEELLLLSLFIWPLPLTAPVYIYNYTGIELKEQGEFSIANPFESLNKKNLGVQISYEAEPKEMVLSCDRKSCAVQDKQGNPVNKISIIKKMSVNQKRIKQLLDAEVAAAAKRKRQKEEQAKEEARMRKQSDRICPQLYDEWWGSGNLQYRKSDVIARYRWAQQWQEYNCNSWLQRVIGGY